jgi:hypothetical protein
MYSLADNFVAEIETYNDKILKEVWFKGNTLKD